MVNGLGVVGWGVGGIEAEAAMLGQAISMVVPPVVGFRLNGELPEGATATDLVLTVTELLRRHGVVGKFVEFYGPGVSNVPVENRATIGNMSPEYGSTITIFPIDGETLRYLRFTGRPEHQVALVEAYAKEQGLWFDPDATPVFSETLELDLATVVPSLAGPSRPQDRVPLDRAKAMFAEAMVASLPEVAAGTVDEADEESFPASDPPAPGTARRRATPPERRRAAGTECRATSRAVPVTLADGTTFELDHGHVVIAAITSCTNTSNPSVMLTAALLARNAVERGLTTKPWVKTTLAPGLEGRHRLLRPRRAHPLPRQARLQPRRLRMHHLHRQLRPARARDLRCGQRARARGRRGAVRQPQLRGPHQPRRAHELPRLPAARRRLRARGHDGRRPLPRAAGHGLRR